MLDQYYDSYGYKNQESFITTAEIKDVKFDQPTRVERHLTEVSLFHSHFTKVYPSIESISPLRTLWT